MLTVSQIYAHLTREYDELRKTKEHEQSVDQAVRIVRNRINQPGDPLSIAVGRFRTDISCRAVKQADAAAKGEVA